MVKHWEADIQITEQQALALIEGQFPDLRPGQIAMFGVGWDNVAFLVNEHIVFRFPRRLVAADLLEHEARILPLLAPDLPATISAPEYVGAPTAGYPYAFAGYPLISGQTACRHDCSDNERAELAPALGHFLAALHHIPLDAATLLWAPRDDIVRADTRTRVPIVRQRLLTNAAGLDTRAVQTLVERVDELATAPLYERALCWVHGDLYARHLVLNDAKQLVGVIDWGDVHVGDPALDLSIAFSFLPPAARPHFRRAYGEIDDATWDRARFRAIHYGPLLVEYGIDIGDPAIQALGEYALRFAPAGA